MISTEASSSGEMASIPANQNKTDCEGEQMNERMNKRTNEQGITYINPATDLTTVKLAKFKTCIHIYQFQLINRTRCYLVGEIR